MQKRTRLAAVAAFSALAVAVPAAAHADAVGVTRAQYRNVLIGETKAQVREALGDRGSVLSRGGNRYGTTLWKVYKNDVGSGIVVKYLWPNTSHAAVVVSKSWCTGSLSDGSLSCAP